jgi:hypothetical protein
MMLQSSTYRKSSHSPSCYRQRKQWNCVHKRLTPVLLLFIAVLIILPTTTLYAESLEEPPQEKTADEKQIEAEIEKAALQDEIRKQIQEGYKKAADPETQKIADEVQKERDGAKKSNQTAQEKLDTLKKKNSGQTYGGSNISEDGTKTTTKTTYQDGKKNSQQTDIETSDGAKTSSQTTYGPGEKSQSSSVTENKDGTSTRSYGDSQTTESEGGDQITKTNTDTSDYTADGKTTKTNSTSSTERELGGGTTATSSSSRETNYTKGGQIQNVTVSTQGSIEETLENGPDEPEGPKKKPDSVSKSVKIAETTISKSDDDLGKIEGASVSKVGNTEISAQTKVQVGQTGHVVKAGLGLEEDETGATVLKGELAGQAEANLIKSTSQLKTETDLVDGVKLESEIKNETKIGAEIEAKSSMQIGKDGVKVEVGADVFFGFKSKTEASLTLNANDSLGLSLKGKAEAEVSAGAGAKGNANAELSWTKIKISGGLAATLGLGFGGKGSVELDASVLITGQDPAKIDLQNAQSDILSKISKAVKEGQLELPEGKKFSDLLNEMHQKAAHLAKHPELLKVDDPKKLNDVAAAALAASMGIKPPKPEGLDADGLDAPRIPDEIDAENENPVVRDPDLSDLMQEEAADQEEWNEEKGLENKHNTLEEFAKKNQEQRQKGTEHDYEGMEVTMEMDEAQHAGDDDRRQARSERNQAGEDAKDIASESNQIVAEGDNENSWSKELGDAIEHGITTGTKTFGQEFGNAAAEKTIDTIWEPEKPQPPPSKPSGGGSAHSSSGGSHSSSGGSHPSSSGMVSSGGQSGEQSSPEESTVAGTRTGKPDPVCFHCHRTMIKADSDKSFFPWVCPMNCRKESGVIRSDDPAIDETGKSSATTSTHVAKPEVCPGDNKPYPHPTLGGASSQKNSGSPPKQVNIREMKTSYTCPVCGNTHYYK